MTIAPGLYRWLEILAMPVCGIGFSYAAVLDWPVRQQTQQARARLAKISTSVQQNSSDHAANLKQLAVLQRQQKDSARLITQTPATTGTTTGAPTSDSATGSQATGSQATAMSPANSNLPATMAVEDPSLASPVSKLSEFLQICHQCALECTATQSITVEAVASSQPGTKKSGQPPAAAVADTQRKLQITLQGTFTDMHRALEKVQSSLRYGSIHQLDMAASTGDGNHSWTLILEL